MANYKPVKITFDLDDPYQKNLYDFVKGMTNGSSYMRTLLHQEYVKYHGVKQREEPVVVVDYQENITEDPPQKTETVIQFEKPSIKINNTVIEDDEIFLDDLI